jgi:methylmalonyl-CoA mutase
MFEVATEAEWQKRLERSLKGAAIETGSILYHRVGAAPVAKPNGGAWTIFMQLDHVEPERARAQAEGDLASGAQGLIIANHTAASVLQHLPLHAFALRNDAGESGIALIRAAVDKQPIDPARLNIDFDSLTLEGVQSLVRAGFTGPFSRADGRAPHGNGLTDAQELGAVLGIAMQRLRKLEVLDDTALSRAVSVTLTASQHCFDTLAKFRAMRLLWQQLLHHCRLPQLPLALHAETSRHMYSATDPHGNILRSACAVFGAGLGGADSICALPFSQAQGVPNGFARRVARNLQLVMQQEAMLCRVADPANGAGYVEHLTSAFCNDAWDVFRKTEEDIWPVGNRENSHARPVVGDVRYQPAKVIPAEIEAAS